MTLDTTIAPGQSGHITDHDELHTQINALEAAIAVTGNLPLATAAGVLGDLAPGAAGQVLTADPTVSGKAKWATPTSNDGLFYVRDYGTLGAGNDTAAITACLAAAPCGATIVFPRGVVLTDAFTVSKSQRLVGEGRFVSWLKPRTAITGPLVTFNITVDSTFGVRANYGPGFEHLGIDLSAAPAATGIRTTNTVGWFECRNFYIQGGAVSIDHNMANSYFSDGVMADAGKFLKVSETGLELNLNDIVMMRVSSGTTSRAIEIISSTAGLLGAVFLNNVRVDVGAPGVLSCGLWAEAPTNASLPIQGENLVIDNCTGPAIVLTKVGDVLLSDCWLSGAAGSGTAAVAINGGDRIKITNSTLFGAGSSIEFTGGATTHVVTSNNSLQTNNPTYKFPGSGPPIGCTFNDQLASVGVGSALCNDMFAFQKATGVHYVGQTGEPPWENGWTSGGVPFDTGGPPYYESLHFYEHDGCVSINGQAKSGTTTAIFSLPVGLRPIGDEYFPALGPAAAHAAIQVQAGGLVVISTALPASIIIAATFRIGG